jgi:putative PIN family toxin of toxin-antitoxin system
MSSVRVVLDTNVIYSALYSSNGASNALIKLVRDGIVIPCLSVTLALEYEEVLLRQKKILQLRQDDIHIYLGFLVSQAERIKIHYLWRPYLKDPKDDMVLEVAVTAGVNFIVTHNLKDFEGCGQFGLQVVTPGWFVKNIGGKQ